MRMRSFGRMFSSLYTCARDTGAGGRAHTQARTRAHACSSSGESSRNSRNSRRPAATASGALQTGGRELVSRGGHALFAAERCNVGTMLRRGRSVFPTVRALAVAISLLAFITCARVCMRVDGPRRDGLKLADWPCASPTPRRHPLGDFWTTSRSRRSTARVVRRRATSAAPRASGACALAARGSARRARRVTGLRRSWDGLKNRRRPRARRLSRSPRSCRPSRAPHAAPSLRAPPRLTTLRLEGDRNDGSIALHSRPRFHERIYPFRFSNKHARTRHERISRFQS